MLKMSWKSLLCLEKDMKICGFHLINIGENTPPLVCVCVRESVHVQLWSPRCTEKPQCDLLFPSSDGISQLKATHTHTETLSPRLLAISCVRGDIIKPHYVRYEPPYSPITEIILCVSCVVCVCVCVCACTCVMRRAYSICWEIDVKGCDTHARSEY